MYAFIRVADRGWSDGVALGAFAVAAALLGAFLAVELRAGQPLTPLWLFTERDRGGAYAIMLLFAAAMLSMFYFLTLFMQQVLGFGPLRAGAAFLPLTLLLFGVARAAPRLLRRFGVKPLVVIGLALVICGLGWLTQVSSGTGYGSGVVGPMLLFGLGGGLSMLPLNATILGGVPPRDAGAASGALQTMQQAGGSLGLAVLVTVFGTVSAGAAADATPHEVLAHGMSGAFAVGAGLAAAALLIALTVIRGGPPATP